MEQSTFKSIFGLNDRVKFKDEEITGKINAILFKHRHPIQMEVVYFDNNKVLQSVWIDDDELELVK